MKIVIVMFLIISSLVLFIPIPITILLNKEGYKVYYKSKELLIHSFDEPAIPKEVKEKKIKLNKPFGALNALKIKSLDIDFGYFMEDFDMMMYFRALLYIVLPTLSGVLNQFDVLHSLRINDTEIENFQIKCIIQISLHKLIMYLIKERFVYGTSN